MANAQNCDSYIDITLTQTDNSHEVQHLEL
jgi:hypothetical protein